MSFEPLHRKYSHLYDTSLHGSGTHRNKGEIDVYTRGNNYFSQHSARASNPGTRDGRRTLQRGINENSATYIVAIKTVFIRVSGQLGRYMLPPECFTCLFSARMDNTKYFAPLILYFYFFWTINCYYYYYDY